MFITKKIENVTPDAKIYFLVYFFNKNGKKIKFLKKVIRCDIFNKTTNYQ